MKKVLIYAGTTEGRELATALSSRGVCCVVSVATEYGKQTMPELENVQVMMGRLDASQMKDLAQNGGFDAVVDATHPFATEVSANIKESVGELPYIRLKRDTSYAAGNAIRLFANSEECSKALEATTGNILLTTGSKELAIYSANEAVRNRLYVRVLPGSESIGLCEQNNIPGARIIAMQGPFSKDMNVALMKHYDIKVLVTKEAGRAGGLQEKLDAAAECGVQTYMIGNPDKEEGKNLEQVVEMITGSRYLDIALVGIGMGDNDTLTEGAKAAIERADYIFGAKRLIDSVWEYANGHAIRKEYYLAKDILPELDGAKGYITILFSGDVGFYSGCTKLKQELEEKEYTNIKVYPGISSVVYMSAKTGIPWQYGKLFSTHGKGEPVAWRGQLLDMVKHNSDVFTLTSGVGDVCEVGKLLAYLETSNQGERFSIWVGCNLSYDDESVVECTPVECQAFSQEGLYTLVIHNNNPERRRLTQSIKDEEFIRAKVPMTKEEVRTISINKLGITDGSVIYDIGSGTGSIAIEMACLSPTIKVYAIEQKSEAVELIRENCQKFGVDNVEVIEGKAPQALEGLEKADFAFIGGSSGSLKDIIQLLYRTNNKMRVVVNAISLETIQEMTSVLKAGDVPVADYEVIQMSVSRNKSAGTYDLMVAENPVYIFSFEFEK